VDLDSVVLETRRRGGWLGDRRRLGAEVKMTQPRTLIIGDEWAQTIDDQLRQIPGTLPLWADVWPGSVAAGWVETARAPETIAAIGEKTDGAGQAIAPPNQVIVALGRGEIVNEPANVSSAELDKFVRKPVNDLLDQLGKANVGVVWVLPPKQPGEGKGRDVIRMELARRGVRMFDPSIRTYPVDSSGMLTDTGPRRLGLDLARWLPLGQPPIAAIRPRHPTTPDAGGIIASLPSLPSMPQTTRGKLALGALLVAGAGIAYYFTEKRNGSHG
jgi:hypothetical protein